MRRLFSLIESPDGLILGATMTDGTTIMLPDEQVVPRSSLLSVARHLAETYGVVLPDEWAALFPTQPSDLMPNP